MSAAQAVERLPPHNMDAEQAVIGACLCDRDAILRVAGILKPLDFYRRAHRLIYRAMLDLYEQRVPPDIMTVSDELIRRGSIEDAGGESYLAKLIAATVTTVHAEYYARIVAGDAARRRYTDAGREIVRLGFDAGLSVDELSARSETLVREASGGVNGSDLRPMSELIERFWEAMDTDVPPAVPWGIPGLDRITGGLGPGQLVMIGARTKVGKSSLALSVAYNVSARGRPAGFISLEMSEMELTERTVAIRSGLSTDQVRSLKGLDGPQTARVSEAAAGVADLPLWISEGSGRLEETLMRARRLKYDAGCELIIIDYLQLLFLGSKAPNRNEELETITRALKSLAKDLAVPIMLPAQINRGSERHDAPRLSDFRSSGAIEQSADIALLLDVDESGATEHSERLVCEVAKHRNGPEGLVNLRRVRVTTQVVEETRP